MLLLLLCYCCVTCFINFDFLLDISDGFLPHPIAPHFNVLSPPHRDESKMLTYDEMKQNIDNQNNEPPFHFKI